MNADLTSPKAVRTKRTNQTRASTKRQPAASKAIQHAREMLHQRLHFVNFGHPA